MNIIEDLDIPDPPSSKKRGDPSAFSVVEIYSKKKNGAGAGAAAGTGSGAASKKPLPIAEKLAASASSAAKSIQTPQR